MLAPGALRIVTVPEFTHVWYWRPRLPGEKERKGQLCRVLVRGKRNSCLVELADGEKVITSRYAVRSLAKKVSAVLNAER